jgi:signal transduction histidine kinase
VLDAAAPSDDGDEALAFEDLLAELSATFVRIPANLVDHEITRWLEKIGTLLRIDRSSIVQVDQSGVQRVSHQWARDGVNPNEIGLNLNKITPWLSAKVANGEVVVVSSTDEFPPEAAKDLEWGYHIGLKSLVGIPFKVGGAVVGAVGFASVLHERKWHPRVLQRLMLVAEIFGSAIERRRSSNENRRLRAEMRQISSVAMMGELTASLAHELNQPLGAVLTNARAARRLLDGRHPDLREVGEALDDIVRDNSRAVETIRQLRGLFQRGEAQMLPVDIRDVFRDVERIAQPDANSNRVNLEVDMGTSRSIVLGDRTQITQAILNLVTNAIDAVCEANEGPRTVTLNAIEIEERSLNIVVCDTGIGIDADIVPKLFDPFFTTKSKGMGMGLAIVKTIVETHRGRVRAYSNPNCGATFEVSLPIEVTDARAN